MRVCILQPHIHLLDPQPYIHPEVAITAVLSCACEQHLASLNRVLCAALDFWPCAQISNAALTEHQISPSQAA